MTASLHSVSEGETIYPVGIVESRSQAREFITDLPSLTEGEFTSVRDFDIEVEYRPGYIAMENGRFLQLTNPHSDPLRLGFRDEPGEIEVIGWGASVPVEDRANLIQHIGRRFFELYSRSIAGTLSEQDEACLDVASRQVDYRAYVAARAMPRYHEATLVRKKPALLIQFLDDRNIKLPGSFESALRLVNDGERFGAWFVTDREGEITAISNPILLQAEESDSLESDSVAASAPVEFPAELIQQLPPLHRPKE